MGKYYTDQERYEWCRKCKLSGLNISTFAKENGIARTTLRDWMHAYNNINGKFINVKTVAENENNIIREKDVSVNILGEIEKVKKSTHFNRFDHSIVEGYVELTNNACERAVKPFVVQRKVFQTSGSYAGARYTAKLFSIIQTCKINNINVEEYLEYVLKNINKIDVKDLTPYSQNISEKLSRSLTLTGVNWRTTNIKNEPLVTLVVHYF